MTNFTGTDFDDHIDRHDETESTAIEGRGGNDWIQGALFYNNDIFAGAGDDFVIGGLGSDHIWGDESYESPWWAGGGTSWRWCWISVRAACWRGGWAGVAMRG